MPSEDLLRRYADVMLDVGLDLRPGRTVAIDAQIEHAPLARLLAEGAYRRGARYVDVWYWDPHPKRSRLLHADAATLHEVPAWLARRYEALAEAPDGGCLIRIAGDPDADLLSDVDPERAGRDRMPWVPARNDAQTHMLVEWTIGCCPTPGWAERVLGEPDVEELWSLVAHLMRLDEPDPVAAWRARMAELRRRCEQLDALGLETIRFEGPGTDLSVGLPEDHRWLTVELVSRRGVRHVVNLPSEEVATSPDPTRAEGVVRSTRPLALGGTVVRDLELRFEGGRIVDVAAATGADVVRAHVAQDPGAGRLGEVALVDGSSRVAASRRLFFDTLLDENAACHLAWGSGIPEARAGHDPSSGASLSDLGLNASSTHTDFMVGGPGVTVTGRDRAGREHLLLAGERWMLAAP
ncbi:MAG TPA: aminopeptidase [Capillimicrobium sp.]|nr:aminopeptidase [Capillimicrobium sp.]